MQGTKDRLLRLSARPVGFLLRKVLRRILADLQRSKRLAKPLNDPPLVINGQKGRRIVQGAPFPFPLLFARKLFSASVTGMATSPTPILFLLFLIGVFLIIFPSFLWPSATSWLPATTFSFLPKTTFLPSPAPIKALSPPY